MPEAFQIPPDQLELLLNLLIATLCGGLIGLNRELHNRPAGLRTHALTALAAALAVGVIQQMHPTSIDAASRVVQGVLTGIGFIGAGVIVHHERRYRVEGLTTAATIWVSSMIGIACGSGHVLTAVTGVVLTLLVLSLGTWLEHHIDARFRKPPPTLTDDDEPPK
ncbi:MgtC/SapB family protein [Pseudomonas sp. MT3]|uniref:MgtC/SapB family protein n=1 Tax=Pseudomonas sp. ATCC 13867 TaxID=1294143 RepID=UPI0002C4E39F|nr:MgtC/SapB family protein [Pseudomonas sp. ATCC 13867]AGI23863.1 sulfur-regulated protein [Pseudomonas sp. ATCC 13867]RFQ16210.1 MgtC/SapB family protein [Pseudomonas sp. ATCC 13867]